MVASVWYMLWGIGLTVHPALLAGFYLHRGVAPIKHRLPLHFFALGCCWSIFCNTQCIAVILIDSMPIFLNVVFVEGSASMCIDMFTLIAFIVYIRFDQTRGQLQLIAPATDPVYMEATRKKVLLCRWLLRKETIIGALMASLGVQITMQLVFTISNPELFSLTFHDMPSSPGALSTTLISIAVPKMALSGIILTFLLFRLNIVVDAFGTKRLLKQILGCLVVALLVFFIANTISLLPIDTFGVVLVLVNTVNCAMVVGIVVPLWQASCKSRVSDSTQHDRRIIDAFLQNPERYDAFKQQLRKESSVECIEFFAAVSHFRDTFDTVPAPSIVARRIIDNFILPGAPLEVKFPHDISDPFTKPKVLELTHRDLFDEALEHVLWTLQFGPLTRFLKANAQMWARFIREIEEERIHVRLELEAPHHTTRQPSSTQLLP